MGRLRGGSEEPVEPEAALDDLYWQFVQATGWTEDVIDRLTLARVEQYQAAWRRDPPWPWALKAALGVKPAAKEEPQHDAERVYTDAEVKAVELEMQTWAAQINGRPGTR